MQDTGNQQADISDKNQASENNRPLWLLAELTYKCPLQCAYCSNPLDFAQYKDELSTEEWLKVFREGRKLGAVQLGFSGGEPLVRQDLDILVKEVRRYKLIESPPDYLIQPAIPLDITVVRGYDRSEELIKLGYQAARTIVAELALKLDHP